MSDSQQTVTSEQEMLNWGRLLMDGLVYADLLAARDRGPEENWFDFWMSRADHYEKLADESLATGHRMTAGYWLWVGSMAAQYAQFLWFDERRPIGQDRKVELYRRAAPLLDPPAERYDLPIDNTTIVSYLRLPKSANGRAVPCVVLLGGLESTKEESYLFENLLLERGLATITFDGPGQGEMLTDVALAGDFERYSSKVLDHLKTLPSIDAARIGVLGRSLGGHYALRAAATDPRFRACLSWGGFVQMDDWDFETPMTKQSWKYVTNSDTLEQAQVRVRDAIDIRPVLAGLTCPTYFQHGAKDELPMSEIDQLKQYAVNAPLVFDIEPEGDHCCHNLGPAPRLRMADWMADQLTS
ncbi:alpha/beta hydrolase [Flexivirga endophytica]|uniref:Alpha/beta hydrolase n=1 Tax=Flexivirga endophytica TaxID=1849103 RepID=A0A916WPZ6_9MICO|nr:alpha/beta hydrolase [Flexivirga endophytica]GGB21660.1 alpha/beta hydrolase [Flexivirga endophytica]GHB59273.1 alpha/beta hydrolase [Flexivirga endophytica]